MKYSQIPAGKNPPEDINVIIEIPEGSQVKYEVDKDLECIVADRFLHGAMYFPFNYGYVPQTHAEDGDPLDVVVLSEHALHPGIVISCIPVGMLEMEDEAGIDTKIIAIPAHKIDPFHKHINDIEAVPQSTLSKIKNFFDRYKDLEDKKWVKTRNFLPAKKAREAIKKAL